MDAPKRSQLQQLQEELVALKASYPDLKLKKTLPSVPGAPFPITVTAAIEAPPEASYIDVDSVQIKATIGILSTPDSPPVLGGGNENSTQHSGGESFSTTVEIEGDTLPIKLKLAILSELETVKSNPTDQSICHLGSVFSFFKTEFARLLCGIPDCLERYQGVDAAGGTVRRVAILRDDAEITIDTSLPSPKAPPPSSSSSSRGGSILPRALQAELEALKKRYPMQMIDSVDECTSILEKLNIDNVHLGSNKGEKTTTSTTSTSSLVAPIIFNIAPAPTDPEWKPEGSLLHLTCFITTPSEYPAAGSFGVVLEKKLSSEASLLPSPPLPPSSFSLSSQEIAVCDRLLQMEAAGVAGRPGALRSLLRQCENRAGELFYQAIDMAVEIERRRAVAAASSGERNPSKEVENHGDSEYSGSEDWDGHSGSYSSEEGEGEDHEEGEDQAYIVASSAQNSQGVLLHNSLYLLLSDLNLVDIDTLDILKLTIQLTCNRCHAASEAVFAQLGAGGGTAASGNSSNRNHLAWQGECTTCHQQLEVTVAPRIVHDGSNILAVLKSVCCAPTDMLPSMLAAQCSSCSSMAAFRSVQIGKWNERNCGQCHRRMAFLAPAVEFKYVQRSSNGGGRAGGKGGDTSNNDGKNARSDRDIVITPGQPLPDFGTCRHYRHSKRWLRFPCCGRRFACDLCHEEGVVDGHEMKWAGRMVCGYCSVEQSLDNKCNSCGKTLATSATRPSGRRTAFWEGGEGQRDKSRLSKRDPHKFRGSKHKTRSKKDLRVGQKGKERTERAAAKD